MTPMQKIVAEGKKRIDEGETSQSRMLSVEVMVGKPFINELVNCCSAEGLEVLVVADVPESDAWNTEISRRRQLN